MTDAAPHMLGQSTLVERIYQSIRDQMLSLKLPPGTRLKDTELAAAFGTSNTPVREALRRLETAALVETIPRRGTFVKRLSRSDVQGLYEVREALEVLAVRLAVERASDVLLQQVAETAELHLSTVKKGNIGEYLKYDRRFHELIAEGSDNSVLASMLFRLGDRFHVVRRMDLEDSMSGQEHSDIAAALLDRDGKEATRLMKNHIRVHRDRVLDILGQKEANGDIGN